ncbi:MAG: beta-galactosidase [Lunatimonas sp.]|nr:beta-galactosidase [Lunatimonas sp.]
MEKSIGSKLDMINRIRFSLSQSLLLGVMLVAAMAGSACQRNFKVSEAPIQPHFFQWQTATIPLSGTWDFGLDPEHLGIKERWFSQKLTDTVTLPGTTDENKKGQFIDERVDDRLSRVWFWKGAAWYQKEVEIPADWIGKRIQLFLERTKDTHVWVNDTYVGYENTLSGPQFFDLTAAAKEGTNRLSLLIDNSILPPVGPAHAIDERTQTNWNGVVGRLELQATDPVWIDQVQTYPDVANNRVKVVATIGNITSNPVNGTMEVQAESWNVRDPVTFKGYKQELVQLVDGQTLEFFYDFGTLAPRWDEFDPALIRLTISLSVTDGISSYRHSMVTDFGMREFVQKGKHLLINGDRVFLRGRIDCANYPLTGYAPMDRESWLGMFRLLKAYGINHWRFHTWFPPKEALVAADMVGVYLQPELPNKRSGMDLRSMDDEEAMKVHNPDYLAISGSKFNMTLKDYLHKEAELIFRYFGNHPSFTLFTLGNELGRNPSMFELVAGFKEMDSRRLYAQGSNNMHWEPSFAEGDDFWVISRTDTNLHVRGANFHGAVSSGHVDNLPPSTLIDYDHSIGHVEVPVIAHETGAYQVSPDFSEIPKFTGVTRARNFELFEQRLKDAQMYDQYPAFVAASGKLAAICYREEVEAALRTSDLAGFQLLDIMDFPGQGTAPVGILNVFMESKGLIEPEEWRRFCSEVVPLLKMEKYTWTNEETFSAQVDVAHYGKSDFLNPTLIWELKDRKGKTYRIGKLQNGDIRKGMLHEVGKISFPLNEILVAEKLTLTLSIEGTSYSNKYDVWVYPESVDLKVPDETLVSRRLDAKTMQHLESGGKVILFPEHDRLPYSIRGAFQTDYWSYPMFLRSALNQGKEPAPGSLGFVCDPDSPLLANFPTEFHSNWQWWHLVKNARPIILDNTPADYRPLVQTIDNFARNHKLGMIFETKMGKGSVLVCAIDIPNLQHLPEARQLYYSLIQYVNSPVFSPQFALDTSLIAQILP